MMLALDLFKAVANGFNEQVIRTKDDTCRIEFDHGMGLSDGVHLRNEFCFFFSEIEFYHRMTLRQTGHPAL